MVRPGSFHRRSGNQRTTHRVLLLAGRRIHAFVWCVSILWLFRYSHPMDFYSEPQLGFGDRPETFDIDSSHHSHSIPMEPHVTNATRVVVSFKTMPSRIQYIDPVLKSLLEHQSMPLDKLYVVLPKTKWMTTPSNEKNKHTMNRTNHYKVPDFLNHRVKDDPRLEILRPEHDYGPVDKMLYALQRERTNPNVENTVLIYVDDDVVYHPDLLKTLVAKGLEYPNSAVALSGCHLRSRFRQISHKLPRPKHDVSPNLYYLLSGTASVPMEEAVDVVQGFTGVLVRPVFFDLREFEDLVRAVTRVADVWKADDFVISGYLAHRNITRWVVQSEGWGALHTPASTKDNLGTGMHRQAMRAAVELQARLGIWESHNFLDYDGAMDDYWRSLVDCEAGLVACPVGTDGTRLQRKDATSLLDDRFGAG